MRWLFVKRRFDWPRARGHDLHTFGLMKALAEQGHAVGVFTLEASPDAALEGIGFAGRYGPNDVAPAADPGHPPLSYLQRKFQGFWGVEPAAVRAVAAAARDCAADAVVACGMGELPLLAGVGDRKRVWYAADEWVWHHLSQMKLLAPGTWGHAREAGYNWLCQRAFRPWLDRVWVVTPADARAFRRLDGYRNLDVVPNGVDADQFAPGDEGQTENSCVFWGRLDYGPNLQALAWFADRVWPTVRARVPTAVWRVYGFAPTADALALGRRPGVELVADLPDLRAAVRGNQVAVLPFVSGGGIKNKVLEAAALGLPVVASDRACLGLAGDPPFARPRGPAGWVDTLVRYWADPDLRAVNGLAGREWVVRTHTWAAAARVAAAGVGAAQPEPVSSGGRA